MDDRDLELLEFIAEHRFILPTHAESFLGRPARRSLTSLLDAGLIERERSLGGPGCYLATRQGFRAAGRSYRPRAVSYGSYQHDVGLAWLWLATRAGTFGEMREIVSERAMRSSDRSPGPGERLGVRLGGYGASGTERLHYPDLLLITPDGQRIAFELELTGKSRTRRERILAGYGADARIAAVVYLVQSAWTGRAIQDTARRIGISDLVHVQRVTGLGRAPAQARSSARAADRELAR